MEELHHRCSRLGEERRGSSWPRTGPGSCDFHHRHDSSSVVYSLVSIMPTPGVILGAGFTQSRVCKMCRSEGQP